MVGALAFVLAACSQKDTESTELGTEVNFVTRGTGDSLINGQVITMSMWYGIDGKAMNESKGDPIPYQYIEDTLNMNGEFANVLEILSVGDSVVFEVAALDLFNKTFRQNLPDSIAEDAKIEWRLKVATQHTLEDYRVIDQEKRERASRELAADEERKFDEYFAQESIVATKTESGLQYVITEMGDGPMVNDGQEVTVRYKGSLFEGGKVFDQGDYTFPLGRGQVIRGWDIGISLMPVGTKGVLYIPSVLGYGARGSGPIPPNSSLVFEVEVLSVK